MTRTPRRLLPWEQRVGCPTCKQKPGQRCITTQTRYPPGYRFRDGTPALGRPTTAHKARYELWCYLWGRERCLSNPAQKDPHTHTQQARQRPSPKVDAMVTTPDLTNARALTLWRPWPTMIFHFGKDIENRNYPTGYRGILLIHAGQEFDSHVALRADERHGLAPNPALHPTGIVGIVTLTGICDATIGRKPRRADRPPPCDCSDWAVYGSYHWRLTNPQPLTEPVPCRGQQSLWRPAPGVLAEVKSRLAGPGRF